MKSPGYLWARDIQGHSVTRSSVVWFKPFLLASDNVLPTTPQGTGKASFRRNAKDNLPPRGKGHNFSCK